MVVRIISAFFGLRSCLFLTGICFYAFSHAQSTTGITGKPDTSYTNYSALNSTRKSHPAIELVAENNSKLVKTKKDIVYCEIGTRKLRTDLFYPAKQYKRPRTAFIMIHGGGWRSGDRSQHHALAQRMAALGYVSFTPEYRLSTEALFPAAIYDLKAFIRWIHLNADLYNVDTTKIAIAGFSAGGELAAFMGTTVGNKEFEGDHCTTGLSGSINAIIDMDGTLSFVHPEGGEGDDSKKTSAATYWFGYPKKDNWSLWEKASPLTHVSAATPPTLFINSAVARMHAGRDDFRKVLDKHGIYSEVHEFEGAPHSFPLFDPWFEPMIDFIDAFLKKVFHH